MGYESTNIYRIWNPKTNDIVRVRDVSFNEDELFSGSLEQFKDDLLSVTNEEMEALLKECSLPPLSAENRMASDDLTTQEDEETILECIVVGGEDSDKMSEHDDSGVEDEEMQEAPDPEEVQEKELDQYSSAILDPLLTPGNTPTPPTALLAAAFSL